MSAVSAVVVPTWDPMLYVDHAATTPMRPEVAEAMRPFYSDTFGNPSGVHEISRRAKDALEEARERVAQILRCEPLEVVFTSGGTESDNLALKGAALAAGRRGGVVTVATEHEAVLQSAAFLSRIGCPVKILGVDRDGLVDPEAVAAAVDEETAVVSVMWANNETGVIQPVAEIAAAVRAVSDRVLVHSDAVQAAVSEEVTFDDVDLLTIAGHKFGGPKGVGVLVVRSGTLLEPVLHGGGQELGRRSGTHNVAGAVGFATALELAVADRERFRRDVGEARRRFEERLISKRPDVVINAPEDRRLVQHSHVRIPGTRNETVLIRLDRAGVAASAGSACQSGASTPSHVLTAMGRTFEEARESLRFSFGWTTRPEDGDELADAVVAAVEGPA
ncbi:MAG: cysteine desulfurase family protein [Actinomycetes bacterium]|mgnify:CR=1 FL=1